MLTCCVCKCQTAPSAPGQAQGMHCRWHHCWCISLLMLTCAVQFLLQLQPDVVLQMHLLVAVIKQLQMCRQPQLRTRCASAPEPLKSWWRRWVSTLKTSSSTPTSSLSALACLSTTTMLWTSSEPLGRSSGSALAARSVEGCPTLPSPSGAMRRCGAAFTVPSCTMPAKLAWTWASSMLPR